MSALWEKPAELMLDRDRLTRPAIAAEFEQYSQATELLLDNSIEFDRS